MAHYRFSPNSARGGRPSFAPRGRNFRGRTSFNDESKYVNKVDFVNLEEEATDTDVWALNNGYVSIVPSYHDLTDYKGLAEIKTLLD